MRKFILAATAMLALAVPTAAQASLTTVGPTDNASGVPTFYGDSLNNQLAFCVNDPKCGPTPALADFLNPDQSGEAFFFRGVSDQVSVGGGTVGAVFAVEAAFPNGPKAQTFVRMRMQAKKVLAAGTYHAETPYGDFDFDSDGIKRNMGPADVICLQTAVNGPCDFSSILGNDPTSTNLGTFLKSTTAPVGYYGDSATPSTVTGGNVKNVVTSTTNPDGSVTTVTTPTPINTFTVTRVGTTDSGTTDQWTITGKMFDPAAPPLTLPVPPAPKPVVTPFVPPAPVTVAGPTIERTVFVQQGGPETRGRVQENEAPRQQDRPRQVAGTLFQGRVVSVNRASKTFRLRTQRNGTVTIKVTAATRYEHLAGFRAITVGKRLEARTRRVNGVNRATLIETSGKTR